MQFNNERLIGGITTDGSQSVSVHLMVFNHLHKLSFILSCRSYSFSYLERATLIYSQLISLLNSSPHRPRTHRSYHALHSHENTWTSRKISRRNHSFSFFFCSLQVYLSIGVSNPSISINSTFLKFCLQKKRQLFFYGRSGERRDGRNKRRNFLETIKKEAQCS